MKLTGDCARITNLSNEAKAKLLRMQLLCGKPVTVTEPWANSRAVLEKQPNTRVKLKLMIAFGVPNDVNLDEKKSEYGCIWIRKLNNKNADDDTSPILLAFEASDHPPATIKLNHFLQIRLRVYKKTANAMPTLLDVRASHQKLPQ